MVPDPICCPLSFVTVAPLEFSDAERKLLKVVLVQAAEEMCVTVEKASDKVAVTAPDCEFAEITNPALVSIGCALGSTVVNMGSRGGSLARFTAIQAKAAPVPYNMPISNADLKSKAV